MFSTIVFRDFFFNFYMQSSNSCFSASYHTKSCRLGYNRFPFTPGNKIAKRKCTTPVICALVKQSCAELVLFVICRTVCGGHTKAKFSFPAKHSPKVNSCVSFKFRKLQSKKLQTPLIASPAFLTSSFASSNEEVNSAGHTSSIISSHLKSGCGMG